MRTEARFPEVPEKAGHYESFYLKLTQPGGGRAAWIRHTVHKRPGEPADLRALVRPLRCGGGRAARHQAPVRRRRAQRRPGTYIRVADASLTDGRATGRVETALSRRSWDLSFSDDHEPFHHLPRDFLYRSKLPKTKFLSPYPDAVFNGRLELDGEPIEVEGVARDDRPQLGRRARRALGLGRRVRASRAARAEDYFDMAVGRIKVGGRTTPWVGNAMLDARRQPHRLGGFGHIPSTRSQRSPTGASFELKGKGVKSRAAA